MFERNGFEFDRTETNEKIEEGFCWILSDKGFAIDKANEASKKSFSGLDIINFKKGNFEKKTRHSKDYNENGIDFHLGSKTPNIENI